MHPPRYIEQISDWDAFSQDIINDFPDVRIILLRGDLGAGKTSLVQSYVRELGLPDVVTSPTYAIVQEYGEATCVYHMDLYRLTESAELMDLGIEDMLSSDATLMIEWPDLVLPYLHEEYLEIHIDILPKGTRKVVLSHHKR